MLPENQTNKNPSQPESQTIPRSMRDSGANLDEGCGEITQSEVPSLMDSYKGSLPQSESGISLDEVFRKYEKK